MGNTLSTPELKSCGLCTTPIPSGPYVYYDIVCSKCNLRCKSYYHSDCLHSYTETHIKDAFVCPTCNNMSNNGSNEISQSLI